METDSVQGFWISDGKPFANKLKALSHATASNTSVSYYFHNHIWKSAVKNKTDKTLDELYKDRAQQLRDKYRYLILNYSGGSDSYNILQTFIKNNIPIDALQVKWPLIPTSYHSPVLSSSSFNLLSEWELTILPSLKEISSNHPNIKIYIEDWSGPKKLDLENLQKVNHLMSIGDLLRFSTSNKIEHHEGTGSIWGIDKPLVCSDQGKFGFFFRDNFPTVGQSLFGGNIEYFYWSPDYPQIVVEQSRILIKNLSSNLFYKKDISMKRNSIEQLRYSSIDALYNNKRSVFQVDKYHLENKRDWDSWIYNSPEFNPYVSNWEMKLKELYDNIDHRFFILDSNGNKLAPKPVNSEIFWFDEL